MAVYILEDDQAVNDSLVVLLQNMGEKTKSFADAESFFRHGPPTADNTVLVDLVLPGTSGAEVIRWLQGLREPPLIVAITAQPQAVIEAQLRGLSIAAVLRKPLSGEAIAVALGH